jgi:hypothetical protein
MVETVGAEVQADADLLRLPWGAYKFRVASSPIHGRGLFATYPAQTCLATGKKLLFPAARLANSTVCLAQATK